MDAFLASVIAVGGTLSGSGLTYLFQVRQSRRTEAKELLLLLRQERIAAYTGFIAAAADFRRSASTHWYRKREGTEGEDFLAARDEADRLQGIVDRAIAQIQLLSDDAPLMTSARRVRGFAVAIRSAASREERDAQADHYRAALDEFTALASQQLVPRLAFGSSDGLLPRP